MTGSRRICLVCGLAALLGGCSGLSVSDTASREIESHIESDVKLYQSEFWTDRLKAVEDVSAYRSRSAEKLLISASDDNHERIRIQAIKELGTFWTDKAFQTVLMKASREKDGNVRWIAFQVLSSYKRVDSFPVLAGACNDQDWLIRETVISGILDIDDEAVKQKTADLALAALTDPVENVRIAAMVHLTITDSRVYQLLARQLSSGMYYRRTSYLKALLPALGRYKLDKEIRSVVFQYLTHPVPDIRVLALHVIKSSDEK